VQKPQVSIQSDASSYVVWPCRARELQASVKYMTAPALWKHGAVLFGVILSMLDELQLGTAIPRTHIEAAVSARGIPACGDGCYFVAPQFRCGPSPASCFQDETHIGLSQP